MNSRWSDRGAALGLALLLTGLLLACAGGGKSKQAAQARKDPAQVEAELLGRELAVIVDRVMAYRSSHRGQLPSSLRLAGIDSLAPDYIRRLARQGDAPLITIAFRRLNGRKVASCKGTNQVLEEAMLREGQFDADCILVGGGTRLFTIYPPPPPKEKE